MNKVIIIGNLGHDPELKQVQTANGIKNVCEMSVGADRWNGEATDWFKVKAWGKLGENCSRYLSKGKKVMVSGPVSAYGYQRQDGSVGVSLEVTADEVEFLSPAER